MGRPRIRTVKPDIWEHEKLGRLARDERLLFVVLITMADDDGRLRALPRQIIGHGYSHDRISERQVEKWLGALERNLLITRYGTGREVFLAVRGFRKHQRINRYTPSVLPPPPGEEHPADELFSEAAFQPHLTEASHPEVEVEVEVEVEAPRAPQRGADITRLWQGIVEQLRGHGQVRDADHRRYVEGSSPAAFDGDTLTVEPPSDSAEWVRSRFGHLFAEAASELEGRVVRVVVAESEEERHQRALADRRSRRDARALKLKPEGVKP